MSFSIILTILLVLTQHAQTRVLLTYVDNASGEARVGVWNEKEKSMLDLGFNKTYHPAKFGEKILMNGDSFVWSCAADGSGLRKIIYGYKAAVSHREDKFACYTGKGIGIVDSSGKTLKEIEVDPWTDMSVTWSENDESIYYYELVRQTCYRYDLHNDSLSVFGRGVYQPVFFNGRIAFNKLSEDGIYSVFHGNTIADAKEISGKMEMALVPSLSHNGRFVAYLSILPDSLQPAHTDMFRGRLCLYDSQSGNTTILSENAGFSDQVFPQASFSEDDRHILFTTIGEQGFGEIYCINVLTGNYTFKIAKSGMDIRFPRWLDGK